MKKLVFRSYYHNIRVAKDGEAYLTLGIPKEDLARVLPIVTGMDRIFMTQVIDPTEKETDTET